VSTSQITLRRLPPGLESYGAVMLLLSRLSGYERAHFGPLARAVSMQIERGTHIAAFTGNTLFGYAGGLPVDEANAELWLAGEGALTVVNDVTNAKAWSVSVFASHDARIIRLMLRQLRASYSGVSVYFRRDYPDGRKSERKKLNPV
jgi:hypothetical protein